MVGTEVNLEDVAATFAMRAAWARVRSNGGGAGGDGMALAEFHQGVDARLAALSDSVLRGKYRPGPLRPVPIRKSEGRIRLLRIPCVADRVVQTACQAVLSARLDSWMSADSYGYRPARSVEQALTQVRRLIATGHSWVFDADIATFFDAVPHDRLRDDLAIWISDSRIVRLIGLWLDGFGGRRGLAQGAPISPLLSNLFLHPLDRAVAAIGPGLVRYADDFVVLARSRARVEQAADIATAALRRRGLLLNTGKTRIGLVAEGLSFLGQRLVPNSEAPYYPSDKPVHIASAISPKRTVA